MHSRLERLDATVAKALDLAQNILVTPLIRPDYHHHTRANFVHAGLKYPPSAQKYT
jgi:hypothetical protein